MNETLFYRPFNSPLSVYCSIFPRSLSSSCSLDGQPDTDHDDYGSTTFHPNMAGNTYFENNHNPNLNPSPLSLQAQLVNLWALLCLFNSLTNKNNGKTLTIDDNGRWGSGWLLAVHWQCSVVSDWMKMGNIPIRCCRHHILYHIGMK